MRQPYRCEVLLQTNKKLPYFIFFYFLRLRHSHLIHFRVFLRAERDPVRINLTAFSSNFRLKIIRKRNPVVPTHNRIESYNIITAFYFVALVA